MQLLCPGKPRRPFLALGESWSNHGICAHTVCYTLKTAEASQWTVQQSLTASSKKLARRRVCSLHWEEAQTETGKLSFLAAIFEAKPSFTLYYFQARINFSCLQEPELAVLINSYSRFNEHANVKLAFPECLQRHRDAEKEEVWASSELRRKTCLSLNKFQVLWR